MALVCKPRPAAALLSLASLMVTLVAAPAAAQPWLEPFSGTGSEIQAAAAEPGPTTDSPVVVLHEERRVSLEPDGRRRSVYRQVYRVVEESALRNWSSVEAAWDDWYQNRPEIRARTIDHKGLVYQLDPKTIETNAPPSQDPEIYSDRRELRAPLPAVAPGAIVEVEIAIADRESLYEAGVSDRFYFGGWVPVLRSVLVLDFPVGFEPRLVVRGLPDLKPGETRQGGRRELRFSGGPFVRSAGWIPNAPSDSPTIPYVGFASGASWNAVASRYAAIAEQQLAGTDLSPLVASIVSDGDSREVKIRRLVEWLGREIRYTGVQFGDASLVPRSPNEVLARRYGDCKDKGLLLVALLKAAGIQAELALVRTGPGLDVEPGLPGIGSFNHAIVRIGGFSPVWIDATDPFSRPGELPGSVQGRLALVASKGTRELTRVPAAAARANSLSEERRYTLEEGGTARLRERTVYEGSPAQMMRAYYAAHPRKKLEEQLTSFARSHYRAEALSRFDFSDPRDLSKPFALELEAEGISALDAEDEYLALPLPVQSLFHRLPPPLRPGSEEPPADPPRKLDFVLDEPYVHEIRVTAAPPHGYVPAALPANRSVPLGSARVTYQYKRESSGALGAVLRFETGKTRLTPAELQEFQQKLKEHLAEDPPALRFDHVAHGFLAAGRKKEALEAFRALEREHPGTALHALDLSSAYLAAGLGALARETARRAADLEPNSAYYQRRLGWTLEHDLLGRYRTRGWDRAGAEKAYRRAVQLDGEDYLAKALLAILLEHDAEGHWSRPPSTLAESIALYEEVRKAGDRTYDVNLAISLFKAKRYSDLIAQFRSPNEMLAARSLVLAALALQKGAPAATDALAALVPAADQRPEALRVAAAEVMGARDYPLSATLYDAAARGHPSSAAIRQLATVLRQTRKREELRLPSDEAALLKRTVAAVLTTLRYRKPSEELRQLVVPEYQDKLIAELSGPDAALPEALAKFPDHVLTDMVMSRLEVTTTPIGRASSFVSGGLAPHSFTAVAVRRGAEWRILCYGTDLMAIATEAVRLAQRRELADAGALLDFGLKEVKGDLALLHARGEPAEPGSVRKIAAIVAAASGEATPQHLEPLRACHEDSLPGTSQEVCRRFLIAALEQVGRYDEALAMLGDTSGSASKLEARVRLLLRAGRYLEAESAARSLVALAPTVPALKRTLAGALLFNGKPKAAQQALRTIPAHPPDPGTLNELAWFALLEGNVSETTLHDAQQGVVHSGRQNFAVLHTLASVLAELDRPEEAMEILLESLALRPGGEARSFDYFVMGRIAETYGEPAAAREYYAQVPKPEKLSRDDTWVLVERRLARMETAALPR